jgi:hypothetical protein
MRVEIGQGMLFLEGYLVTGMTQLVLCESIHAICFFCRGGWRGRLMGDPTMEKAD